MAKRTLLSIAGRLGSGLLLLALVWFAPAGATLYATQVDVGQSSVLAAVVASPPVIHYQGRLLDPATGQPKADGAYQMTFSLYDVNTGGAPLWTETKSVNVSKGLFATLLGDTGALNLAAFDGRDLFLGVTVGGDPEATPRQRVAHVAYAIRAENAASAATAGTAGSATTAANADTLDSQDSTAFASAAHNHDDLYFTEGEADGRFVNTAGPETMSGNDDGAVFQATQNGTGFGIQGHTNSSAVNRAGVYGTAGSLAGVDTPNNEAGVLGKSAAGFGVVGYSKSDAGVYGRSVDDVGVQAESGGAQPAVRTLASGTGHGVYADGATYGFYTPDKVFAGAGYVDIAEHMPAAADVGAGDVVVIDPANDERVIKSYKANDPTVAGVISTEPAMLIGQADSPTPLALAGRVPVKVSAENGPIQRGDLLTTSNTPGHAMKATPSLVNDMAFYAPGTIIGKAMGELESGTGTIIVLVLPQ